MGETTRIRWTQHTFNPWIGCTRVSPGCVNCYAEALAKRTGLAEWGDDAARHVTSDANWNGPLKWDRKAAEAGVIELVFCASLADVFEERPDLHAPRYRLWELIERTPHLVWQLLTKRPENIMPLVPVRWWAAWPANVWIGTTVENQAVVRDRLDPLVAVPAHTRFVSAEPLIGHVNMLPWLDQLHWVIVGGESGPRHRPLNVDHARDLVRQCRRMHVPVFFKQHGGATPDAGGHLLDGEAIEEFPALPGIPWRGI